MIKNLLLGHPLSFFFEKQVLLTPGNHCLLPAAKDNRAILLFANGLCVVLGAFGLVVRLFNQPSFLVLRRCPEAGCGLGQMFFLKTNQTNINHACIIQRK